MKNDILHFEEKYYIFSRFLRKELFKQNHDDSHANHFKYEKILELFRKNIDDQTCRKMFENTSFRAQNVL